MRNAWHFYHALIFSDSGGLREHRIALLTT
ncbi:TPA: DUF3265 domain-containing protein [Vibrio vulnificus]|nr:DUF3265 domain-containing protein [Vibrio vulnificus]MCA0763245.1 DUF3265 domain-containing protein [Vibrio vulnificus]HAS6253662.1 DUF3265 domain-containing protein [Vibrio vulnificus]HAS6299835.1 DUF3265 domain-containing protein [Vibrio vulnificus]HAS6334788.1 DUF3265 domain-containing protein [Vibrio vulnificus]